MVQVGAVYSTLRVDSATVVTIGELRSPVLPNPPSANEHGLTDFETTIWFAFFLPKRTPAPIVEKLNDAAVAAMNTSSVQQQLQQLGVTRRVAARS